MYFLQTHIIGHEEEVRKIDTLIFSYNFPNNFPKAQVTVEKYNTRKDTVFRLKNLWIMDPKNMGMKTLSLSS